MLHFTITGSFAERHVSRQLRLANLGQEVLKRLTCGRLVLAVGLYHLCFPAREVWGRVVKAGVLASQLSDHFIALGRLAK